MMRRTTLAEHHLLVDALYDYLDKLAPDPMYGDDASINEVATRYVINTYANFHPDDQAIKVREVANRIKLALALIASDIHINDM